MLETQIRMIFICILLAAISLASAKTNCTHNSECADGECCFYHEGPLLMSRRQLSRRQDLLPPDIQMEHQGGWCEKYKMEGESCSVFAKINGHCECQPGLICQYVSQQEPVASKRMLPPMGFGSYRCSSTINN